LQLTFLALCTGEGVPLRVEAAEDDIAARGVAFGAVPCGGSSCRVLAIANRGRAAARVTLEPSIEMLQRLGIELLPADGLMLRPHEQAALTLWYRWVHTHVCMQRAQVLHGRAHRGDENPLPRQIYVHMHGFEQQHVILDFTATACTLAGPNSVCECSRSRCVRW
jgi:hypothetical protein